MDLLEAARTGLGLRDPWEIIAAGLEEGDPGEVVVEGTCPIRPSRISAAQEG